MNPMTKELKKRILGIIAMVLLGCVILGSGLHRLEEEIQKYELKFVKSADRRLAATLKTHIAAVTVTDKPRRR